MDLVDIANFLANTSVAVVLGLGIVFIWRDRDRIVAKLDELDLFQRKEMQTMVTASTMALNRSTEICARLADKVEDLALAVHDCQKH